MKYLLILLIMASCSPCKCPVTTKLSSSERSLCQTHRKLYAEHYLDLSKRVKNQNRIDSYKEKSITIAFTNCDTAENLKKIEELK